MSPNISGLNCLQLSVNTHGSLWSFIDFVDDSGPRKEGLESVQAHV